MWTITRSTLGARFKGKLMPPLEDLHELPDIFVVQGLRVVGQGWHSAMMGKTFTCSSGEYGCRGSACLLKDALLYWVDVNAGWHLNKWGSTEPQIPFREVFGYIFPQQKW